ncbi:hypothetical protein [Paenibacillus sp. GYB003]|uniref:hypothetical protein n=1 Tax=Paenibacillus sp. GYB003 TaxID=2994392 RepID=UPI002F96AD5E
MYRVRRPVTIGAAFGPSQEGQDALGFDPAEVPDAAYPKQAIQLLEFAQGISKTITNPELQLFR